MRKKCKPHGPIGYLLESIHFQGAALVKQLRVRQWNQPKIEIARAPYQHLAALIRQMSTRNSTRSNVGCRMETENLEEID